MSDLFINIICNFIFCVIIGRLAQRITRFYSGILCCAFIGFAGIVAADLFTKLIGWTPHEIKETLLACLIGACMVSLGMKLIMRYVIISSHSYRV